MSTTKRRAIRMQGRQLSPTFHKDVQALLNDTSIDEVELDTILTYLKAAALVSELKSYKAMKEEDFLPRHCVRCHDTFTKDNNGPGSCVIPHVFDSEASERWGDGLFYTSGCCGERATFTDETPGNCDYRDLDRLGKCFEGRHTTFDEAVQYNGINFLPCKLEDGECVTEYLENDNDPVFKSIIIESESEEE